MACGKAQLNAGYDNFSGHLVHPCANTAGLKVVFSMAMLTYGKSPPRTTTLPGLIGHLMTRAMPRWKAQNPVYDFDWFS